MIMAFLFCLNFTKVIAQKTDTAKTRPATKISLGFKEQLSATTDFTENLFVHFGGPGLTLSYNKSGFFLGLYSSSRFYGQGKVSPLLGMGFQLMFGKFVFPVVIHNINSQNDPHIPVT